MRESDYYPAGAYLDSNAPYNETEVPEKDFEVTCCQVLSRTATVTTSNYILGASGVDYEPDDEGGYCACGWQDDDDTSDTCWGDEYKSNGYKTPLELIDLLKEYLEKDLMDIQRDMLPNDRSFKATKARMLKRLIEECECWSDDETDFEMESD